MVLNEPNALFQTHQGFLKEVEGYPRPVFHFKNGEKGKLAK